MHRAIDARRKSIILISDGAASASSSNMPTAEKNNQCHEAITAAQSATTAGFWVYSIAYGAASTGCSTDSPSITPCAALLAIAALLGQRPEPAKARSVEVGDKDRRLRQNRAPP